MSVISQNKYPISLQKNYWVLKIYRYYKNVIIK